MHLCTHVSVRQPRLQDGCRHISTDTGLNLGPDVGLLDRKGRDGRGKAVVVPALRMLGLQAEFATLVWTRALCKQGSAGH